MNAPGDQPVGTVAEEAARLFESLTGRPLDPSAFEPPADKGGCHHPPVGEATTCAVCPVCRGILWVRTLSPETIDRLADLASAAATSLRELAARGHGEAPPEPAGHRSRVVDIEVVDVQDGG